MHYPLATSLNYYHSIDIILDKLEICIELVDISCNPEFTTIKELMLWVLFLCSIAGSWGPRGNWFDTRLSFVASEPHISHLHRNTDGIILSYFDVK